MGCFFVYGKRTAEKHWNNYRGCWIPQDKQFRALNANGVRVNKLTEAIPFATKEDAEEFINKHKFLPGVELEIRYKAE